ncbi:glycosyltransferase family 4 protein [Pseudoduganella violacea]|uniref:Glycosyltransferase involved in cell wall biosynthesis n=1 Tax=Pseudoduganella violacea TaxID=1715466 RepID=A0A7W5BAW5_9BURK|nr:glycosyltransferase family 4 protein [Pseudoduganella violacea]MBB3119613.1 glycosyltransferase involved in cell wall biosynthesis [Pseudoduganella violacea]
MKKILMLGTGLQTMGGVAAVIRVYAEAGLLSRFDIAYLGTHRDGGKGAKLGAMLGAYARFVGMLCRGQLGLIHVHVASRASFWRKSFFFLLAFLFRIPAILHLHGGEFALFYGRECGPVRQALIRFIYNRASRVIVLSEAWQQWVRGISRNPHVTVIHNPVVMPASMVPWAARRAGTVLALGRLCKGKGSYDLLEAAAQLVAAQPDLQLRLGGDGELPAVAARAAQLGLAEHLRLLGWVSGVDKQAQLEQASVFTLPSYNEGLPMSVLEAMAAGLPVVTTPVGGIPDAVTDGVEGFLVPPGDVAALAMRLQQLLNDTQLAQRMGEAGRRKVATMFATQAVLPQLEKMYTELGFAPK